MNRVVPRPMKIACLVAAGIFGLFGLVQLNDPDPLGWVVIYGLTMAYSAASGFRRLPWYQAAVWGALCTFFAVRIWASWDGASNPMGSAEQGMFAEEVVREVCGLGLIAMWMFVLSGLQAFVAPRVAEQE